MIAILPPIRPIRAGATEAEREAAFRAYVLDLYRLNPRHRRTVLNCYRSTSINHTTPTLNLRDLS